VQAVVFTGEARIALAQRPQPVAGDGEVLIQVDTVGICGTDLHAPAKPAIFTPGVVLGHEFSGTVAAPGTGVRAEPGQPVVVNPIALSCGDVAVSCGADQAVPPDQADRIDRCYDVVFDCTGAAEAFPTSLALVAPGGCVVVLGSYPSPITLDTVGREASVVFSSVYRNDREFAAALRMLSRGLIDTRPLTTAILPLTRHEEAFASLRNPDQAVKIFLDPA
jgi:threonine dehydrogenase-like Zn-dependent dehydrogenase